MSGNLLSGKRVDRTELVARQSQQLEFFRKFLESIHNIDSNLTVVTLLLEQSLDLLDDGMIEVVTNWVCSKFTNDDQGFEDFSLAYDIVNFCIFFVRSSFLVTSSLDDEAMRIEMSIALLTIVTEKITNAEYHNYIVLGQAEQELGSAYSKRVYGDRAENLEESIKHYLSALECFPKRDFPLIRAITQISLANIYSERVKGNHKNNSEKSLDCYRAALEILTTDHLSMWSSIQIKIARVSISQLGNYRLALEHLQAVYERLSGNSENMVLLAETMFELARCFHQTGALGQAKIHFKDAIRLYQRLEKPVEVAAITSELGNLELQMGYIDDARINLQTALEFFQKADNADRIQSIQELQQYLPEFNKEQIA